MMKKMFKKIISLLLSVLIIISILPFDVIRNNILSLKTEAAFVEDYENAYIENHKNFIISSNYNNLINNASFYNAIWRYEENSPNFTAYATWEILGDIGEIASLNFNDLFITQNPYDIILMEILSSNTFSENIVKSSEKILKYAFSAKDIYENLLKILRTSDEWEDSMELDISKELNDMIASCGSSLIDGVVFSAEEYDLKHKNRNVYDILTKILPKVSDNSWNNLFGKINNINTISSYINTGTDIIFTFFDAYQKYLIVDSLVTTNREALDLLLNTSYKMEPKSRAMLNESLNKILEGVNYDSAFNAICNYSVNNLSKTTYSFFREGLSKIVYNNIGKVFGVSSNIAGSINKVVFAYNTTYTILDHISGLGSASDLFNLMHAAALLEKKMLKTVTTYADNLIDSSTLEDAVKFDSGWSLLQSLNTYSYNALSSYISSLKKNYSLILSFDLSFQLTTGITSTFWISAFNEVVNSIKNFKEKINAADASIEASVYLEGEWKNANCHENLSSALPSKMVYVKCPTDVFVYNSQEELALSIVSNKIEAIGEHITANIDNGEKIIYLPSDQTYNIKIEATDDGQMDYGIVEFIENNAMRSVNFDDVTLKEGNYYIAQVDNIVYTSNENYELKSNGDTVKVTYDSLPPTSNQITDIIVSEELFEGFSTELIDKVANAMFKFEPVVDITSYNISTDDTVALFSAISKYYPTEYSLLTKSEFKYKIIFSPSLGCITDIRFYYGDDANLEAFEQRNKDLKAEIDKIVSQVDGMNEFEKALYIHDYIVLNSEYDRELLGMLESGGTLSGELYAEKYSEYSILINGTGICGSYALAYRALMNAAGVDCIYLSSQQMNHAWNMVKIDGEWYHVDCCWDDPVPDIYGDARRTYFLRTDKEIMELNHYSWVPGTYKATSTLYSEMPRKYNSTQKYDNGYWYISNYSNIIKSDIYGKNETAIVTVYSDAVDSDEGNLYYALGNTIYYYDVAEQSSTTALILPSNYVLINFEINDETITYYCFERSADNSKKYIKDTAKSLAKYYKSITDIKLNEGNIELGVFDQKTLAPTIESELSVENISLTWTTDNDNIVSVSESGEIRGNNIGIATITVSVGEISVSCKVTVTGEGLTGYCGNNVTWKYDVEKSLLTVSGKGNMANYSSANKAPWYKFADKIQKVVIDNGVTYLGAYAFFGLSNLENITIPASVTKVSSNTFSDCVKLENILLPDSITEIGSYAFSGCKNLKTITLPSKLTKLNSELFYNCTNLVEVTFPKNLDFIGYQAFYNCISLVTLNIPETVTAIASEAFSGCISLESINIPQKITRFESQTFYNCYNLKNISIPDSVTSIGYNAFANCLKLEEIVISSSVTFIGDQAFSGCIGLKKITVNPKNSHYMSDEYGVLYDKNQTTLMQYPISSQNTSYIVPDSVKVIEALTFSNCTNLKNIEFPKGLEQIGGSAFYNCINLSDVVIPSSVKYLGTQTFYNCATISNLTIPGGISEIPYGCFASCDNLTTVILENGVSSIGSHAFESNDNIEDISIPDSVQYVGFGAFAWCGSLIHVTMGTGVQTIDEHAFEGCKRLKSVKIGENTTSIGAHAFEGCSSLTSITIPANVTRIGLGAFAYCSSVISVNLGSKVEEIGDWAFRNCDSLISVSFPKSTKTIGIGAFYECYKIVHVGYCGSDADLPNVIINAGNESITGAPHIHIQFNEETDVIYAEGKDASCIANGSTGGNYCTICNCQLDGDIIPAKGHKYTITEAYAGDCITPSHKTYLCSVCRDTYMEYDDVDSCHSYIETVTAPTCTEIGYTTATCEHCGENAMYDFVPMLGHDVTVTHTDADCKKCAQTEYSCSRCDYHEIIVDEESGLGEHKISVTVTEATCTENGSIDRICVTCNELISTEVVVSNGHIPGEWETSTDATTESAGKKEKRCIVCKELVEEEEIPKIPIYVSGVALSKNEIEISNKETYLLSATVSPENADDRTVMWASADPSVATVNENGLVTAVSIGETTVSVTTTDGGYTASCAVTVIPREFDITWVVGGHKTVETYKEGSLLEKPSDPVEAGYTFTGWTPEVPDIMPSEDLTFTATWVVNTYNAVFDANGGKWADGASKKTVSTAFDSQITAPEAPVKQGYIFLKWSSEVGVMDSVDGKTFVAEWIAATDTRYTVETYTMNTSGEYVKTTNVFSGTTGESVSVNPTVQTGFTLNKSKSVLSGNVAADNSLVLKVYIDRNTYTFTTVADGVSTSTNYLYGSLIAEPATPVKTGYKFIEWDKTLPETMPANDVTLTAVFDTAYTCPDCGDEIVGESAIAEHIAAEARAKSTVSIKNNPTTKAIKYGETLRLTAIASKPDDVVICWYVDGAKKGEGTTFDLTFESGTKTVEVKLEDADGNVICNSVGEEISDSEEVTVKAGFFQKIISFFKNLFRMDRTVVQ